MSDYSIATDGMLEYAARIVWNSVGGDEDTSRCAKPGEPPRNRTSRCEHGFLIGASNVICPECDPVGWHNQRELAVLVDRPRSPRGTGCKQDARHQRAQFLAAIAAGAASREAVMAALQCSRYSASALVLNARRRGEIEATLPLRLTEKGLSALENGRRGVATPRASSQQTTIAAPSIGACGEVSR